MTTPAKNDHKYPDEIGAGSLDLPSDARSSAETESLVLRLEIRYPLAATVEKYIEPTEPVAEEDWEVLG